MRAALAATGKSARGAAQQLKQITVLFADVADSTRMGQLLDPEDTLALMDGALARFGAIVEAHGGRVLRFMGDGLSAAFGADVARENDPECAVRAGLALLDDAAAYAKDVDRNYGMTEFSIRVGINTGQVLLGGGVEADNSAMGMTINLARRMEESAPRGGLRIAHATYRHVRGIFDASEQPPIAVKGSDVPMRTYLITRARSRALRITIRGIEGVETRMVGRDAELQRLQDTFHGVVEDRLLAAVTVVGDAGLGKTRLLAEMQSWVDLQARAAWWFEARANFQQVAQPYGLLRDLFAWRFKILDSDDGAEARRKFVEGVAPVLGSEADAQLLGHLLNFDLSLSPSVSGILSDAKQIRDRGFHYAAQFFRKLAATSDTPVLLILDDLHWADDGSLDFVNHLVSVSHDVPLLVVGFTRPALYERRPLWGSGQQNHTRIDLTQLSRRNSRELAGVLLQRLDGIPAALHELITGGAEGNPFYMEELVKMLIDDGVIETDAERWRVVPERLVSARVPATLTGVLQARLDSLASEERSALQLAAVVGHVFWEEALLMLDAEAPKVLPLLARRELVYTRETSAFEGVREDVFKHHVLHQVTYDSVLKRVKREAHGKVAAWLAGRSKASHLALIADHYERAGDAASAVDYLQRAGEDAATRFAHEAALMHVERALLLTGEKDAARRYALLVIREDVLRLSASREEQAETLTELERLADELDNDEKRADVAVRRASYADKICDYPWAIAAAQKAIAAAGTSAPAFAAQAHGLMAFALMRQGKQGEARDAVAKCLAITHETPAGRRMAARLLGNLGAIEAAQGDFAAAEPHQEKAIAIAREIGDRHIEAGTLTNFAETARLQADYDTARARQSEALKLSTDVGDRFTAAFAHVNLALIANNLGNHTAARNYAEQALPLVRAINDRYGQASALTNLGHANAALGNAAAAMDNYREARDLFDAIGMHHSSTEPIAGLARLALASGEVMSASRHVAAILSHLDHGGAIDGTDEPLRVYLTCYRVLDALGDPRAISTIETAWKSLQQKAARLPDEAARRRFLEDVPYHREIASAWGTLLSGAVSGVVAQA